MHIHFPIIKDLEWTSHSKQWFASGYLDVKRASKNRPSHFLHAAEAEQFLTYSFKNHGNLTSRDGFKKNYRTYRTNLDLSTRDSRNEEQNFYCCTAMFKKNVILMLFGYIETGLFINLPFRRISPEVLK